LISTQSYKILKIKSTKLLTISLPICIFIPVKLLQASLIPNWMNRIFTVFSCIVLSTTVFCQETPAGLPVKYPVPEYVFGDFSLSLSPNLLCNTPNETQLAGGLKMNAYVCRWLSFETDFVAGRDYYHFGPGIAGIPIFLLFLSTGTEFDSFGAMLLEIFIVALSAEHVAGHILVKQAIDISPYISLLRFKHAFKYGQFESFDYAGDQVSGAFGIQVNKYFNRFYISPYAEVNVGYKDHIPGVNIGINCGYYFYGR